MKYIVLVPDGMADHPLEKLGGKTPLEAAQTPNMDYLVKNGMLGEATTIPGRLAPASDVANLSIMGYDPQVYYSGRAPLEAAYLGVELSASDVALRCNLVTVSDGKMADYSAGHISSKEASVLIAELNRALGSAAVTFYPGVSYRHLLVLKGYCVEDLIQCRCFPPHDILGESVNRHLPKGKKGCGVLLDLMERSKAVLAGQEINRVRLDLHENPATMIWLWGQGQKITMPSFREKFGLSGAVISAVDLIKGIGKLIGLDVISVEGATGYYDTNYQGKAEAGLKALETRDFVFIHVEATDEAGHNGDLRNKIACIERFDTHVVGTILNHFKDKKEGWRLMVLPDHATPVEMRKHVPDAVCVAMMGQGIAGNGFEVFTEAEARKSSVHFEGHQLMDVLLR
ncbi:MAG: cofactor-independent phosphoglycerate mutase [Candidatus Omnitrophota bacterium]